MKIRNKGDRARVIAPPGEPGIEVGAGEVVEVDDDLGKSLCDQSDRWEPAQSAKTEKKETDR